MTTIGVFNKLKFYFNYFDKKIIIIFNYLYHKYFEISYKKKFFIQWPKIGVVDYMGFM